MAALVAMLVGAAAGGILGERWHTKLAARAADPDIGPAAEDRRREAQIRSDREARGSYPGPDDNVAGEPASQQSPSPGPRGARSARTVASEEGSGTATEVPGEDKPK